MDILEGLRERKASIPTKDKKETSRDLSVDEDTL